MLEKNILLAKFYRCLAGPIFFNGIDNNLDDSDPNSEIDLTTLILDYSIISIVKNNLSFQLELLLT